MCKILKWVFAAAYVVALFLFALGTWGWFGADRDPLAGVFVILLGLPWNLFIDSFPDGSPAVYLINFRREKRPWSTLGSISITC